MLIDLHTHTSRYSACSSLTPERLVTLAAAAGLDAICLTEHDQLWPEAEARALGAAAGLIVLRGMEVTTELGHALVYGLEQPPSGMFLASSLSAAVRAFGGLIALAHPARAGQPAVSAADRARLFDCVEALNGSDGPEQNAAAAGYTAVPALSGIAGSDCHAEAEVGTVATRLPYDVTTERELIAALRLNRHDLARLR